ncbi:Fc receptor-like protein 3 isoform X1 [Brachyistius frenatus]|uniref:Fc receptor-like protein 3 isoform X1 n=1 Tax=Brachyistius frenatus TaxID=100188 RepID=UPI0037E8C458
MFASLFMIILGWCYCSRGQFLLGRPRLYGPSEALVKKIIYFHCELPNHPQQPVLLQLFKEDNRDKLLGESTSLTGEVADIPMVIRASHEGYLLCVASAQNNSEVTPTVSGRHHLKVVEPVKGVEIVRSGPTEFYEGNKLELRCNLNAGNHVSYKWLLNGRPVAPSPGHHVANDLLSISRTSSEDSGSYRCLATNTFNRTQVFTSNSSDAVIRVKDLVSDPDISFTVLKEDSSNFSALVTCQSTRGTPPITFSLWTRSELVGNTTTEERLAVFKLPLVMDQHSGCLQCRTNNGNWTTYSQWLPLNVVPVGGPVTMRSDFDTGENYAVVGLHLYCKAAKGSHPRYQWFLNRTLLRDRGSFYYVVDQAPEQSTLLLSVGRSSAGSYHCEVSDSFDNTTTLRSPTCYLDQEVLHRLPVLVVAVVFGSFTVLVVLVCFCCWMGVLFRRRQDGGKSPLSLEMERSVAADEDEPDLLPFMEDPDVVKAAGGDEFYQTSEASTDEWIHMEKERKTLEEEPV